MIRIPGHKPGVTARAVSLIDLTPTLLGLAGATVPGDLDGRTLLPDLLEGAPATVRPGRRPILLNEADQHGVIMWPYKLLIRPAENLFELYDLAKDFGETRDLSTTDKARVRRLRQLYKSYPSVPVDRSLGARERREKLARPPGR
jgi:arylsulfatase A-like enzyme